MRLLRHCQSTANMARTLGDRLHDAKLELKIDKKKKNAPNRANVKTCIKF